MATQNATREAPRPSSDSGGVRARKQAAGKRTRTGDSEGERAKKQSPDGAAKAPDGSAERAGDWVVDEGLCSAMGLSFSDNADAGAVASDSGEGAGRARAGGLPGPILVEMEQSFGEDFSDVRIHEGPEAAAVGAVAYTQGTDIYFQPGYFDPASQSGKELLAHELTHVVQQRAGRVAPDAGPMGKDLPLNADAALEAEADAAGARAARGESAGVSGSGRSGDGGSAGAPIQRYAAVALDGAQWKLSDGNRILTRDAASHEMYAEHGTIAAGEAALAAAGSFITLAGQAAAPGNQLGAQVVQHGLERVVATYRPRGATANAAQTPAAHKGQVILGSGGQREPGLAQLNNNGGGALVTPSQCIDAARVVMGVTNGNGARDQEMPIGNVDGQNKLYNRQHDRDFADADFQNQKHLPSPTEARALTALCRQLLDFLDSRELRALADVEGTKTEVARFRLHAKKLDRDNPAKAWVVLHEIQGELPAVYRAFTRYAGIDAAAAPEVGEALVTYIAETKAGRAFKTNQNLYQDLVAQLTLPVVTQMGITAATPAPKIQEIVKAAADPQDPNYAHHATLNQVNDAHTMWNMHWAGVVLKDGADYASLENDASTKDPSVASGTDAAATATGGDINASWRYQLYGAAQPGQSFHDHMMAGGDFGDFASTMRFRRPAVGEQAIAKAEQRVYGLRMPAGTAPALVDQMRWEICGHAAADAAGVSAATFAAVLTVEPIEGSPSVRVTEVKVLERDMPPRVAGCIEQALEMIDVWRLRSSGPPLVNMDALRERMRIFHYAVKYLLSLPSDAKPVDSYVSVVSKNARRLELDAEIRPRFAPYRAYAEEREGIRHPARIDGFSVGLMFQLLSYLDTNLLWHYERDESDALTPSRLDDYRVALAKQRAEAIKFSQMQVKSDTVQEAKDALPILDRADALLAEMNRVYARLFPAL
jgi:Domain of unknown function (DUF4157)